MVKNQTINPDKLLTSPPSMQVEISGLGKAISPTTNGRFSAHGKFNTSDSDIIDDLLARVIELAPQFSAALAEQVSREIRDQWAGDRPYISRRAGEGQSSRNQQIKRDYQAGEHISLLQRRYKLQRTRLWQIINT